MPNFSYSQCSSPLLNSHLARHTGLLLWRLDPSHVTAGLTRSLSLNLTPNAHHLYPLPLPSRHTGPRAGASPSFQKRIFEKAPESSSGGHFGCLPHTTNHFHFVHFIIPHQRHISFTHNAHHLYALPLNSVTPDLIRCLSLFFSHNVHSLYALPLLFRHTACSFGALSRNLSLFKHEKLKKP